MGDYSHLLLYFVNLSDFYSTILFQLMFHKVNNNYNWEHRYIYLQLVVVYEAVHVSPIPLYFFFFLFFFVLFTDFIPHRTVLLQTAWFHRHLSRHSLLLPLSPHIRYVGITSYTPKSVSVNWISMEGKYIQHIIQICTLTLLFNST